MIYRRYGIGHGPMTLVDALAQSCNVYFFHHADSLGEAPIVDWGRRTGFGDRTGIDLPGEAAGHLPAAEQTAAQPANRQPRHREAAESLAIGQGSLTATPIQVVRMMAAIANGGQLVTPHVAKGLGLAADPDGQDTDTDSPEIEIAPPRAIAGLDSRKLEIVRDGLRRVVADPKGTGHSTAALEGIMIAGKTGTAETGAGSADHAWFAGYAPADAPRIAFVVVLEHAGDAAATAAPAAKRLVERLRDLGDFDSRGKRATQSATH
jgi:penicillin-binding protein 2